MAAVRKHTKIVLGVSAFVAAGALTWAVMLATNNNSGHMGHVHDEANHIEKARERDVQSKKDIEAWSAPKSPQELSKARELVGKVGSEPGSRFRSTEECLASISREMYIEQAQAEFSNQPVRENIDYQAARAACYQRT